MSRQERIYQLLAAIIPQAEQGLSTAQKVACGLEPGAEVRIEDARFFVLVALSELLSVGK